MVSVSINPTPCFCLAITQFLNVEYIVLFVELLSKHKTDISRVIPFLKSNNLCIVLFFCSISTTIFIYISEIVKQTHTTIAIVQVTSIILAFLL